MRQEDIAWIAEAVKSLNEEPITVEVLHPARVRTQLNKDASRLRICSRISTSSGTPAECSSRVVLEKLVRCGTRDDLRGNRGKRVGAIFHQGSRELAIGYVTPSNSFSTPSVARQIKTEEAPQTIVTRRCSFVSMHLHRGGGFACHWRTLIYRHSRLQVEILAVGSSYRPAETGGSIATCWPLTR